MKTTTPSNTDSQALLNAGLELYRAGKLLRAQQQYLRAIAQLEAESATEANASTRAEAYLSMVWVQFDLAKAGKLAERPRHFAAAIEYYEKAIATWQGQLSGNLVNLSALYAKAGNYELAAARAKQGLDLAESLPDPTGDERLAAWNHFAGYCIKLGRLDEAESVLKGGLAIIGTTTPNSSFLLETLADVYEARASQLRQQAEEVGLCTQLRDLTRAYWTAAKGATPGGAFCCGASVAMWLGSAP